LKEIEIFSNYAPFNLRDRKTDGSSERREDKQTNQKEASYEAFHRPVRSRRNVRVVVLRPELGLGREFQARHH